MNWRVWYEDTCYDSCNHKWEDIPDDGVQVVILYKEGRREIMCGPTSYYRAPHKEGWIWDADYDHPDKVIKRYPGAEIKRGKRLPDAVFERIRQEAIDYKWQ